MANFRLEWLHINETTGAIIDVVGVVKDTLVDDTHHQFAPPQKSRRHGHKNYARIVYAGSRLFIRAAPADAGNSTTDNAYMFRYGMNSDGTPTIDHQRLFEVEDNDVLHVHNTASLTPSYQEDS